MLPFSLRLMDFQSAMQDVYDLFHDINSFLLGRSLTRLEEMLRPAGVIGRFVPRITLRARNPLRAARRRFCKPLPGQFRAVLLLSRATDGHR